MSEQFKFSDKYKRSFFTMIGVGVLLMLLGFLYTQYRPTGHGDHGDAHGATHEEGEHAEPADGHGDAHSDAEKMVRFAQAGHGDPHTDVAAGHDHGDGTGLVEDLHSTVKGGPRESHIPELGEQEHSGIGAMTNTTVRVEFYPEQADPMLPVHHEEPGLAAKIGAVWLLGSYWWIAVALFGIFFVAIGYVANAGWYIAFKRILETYYRFLPIGIGLMIVVVILMKYVYSHWAGDGVAEHDRLIAHKGTFLNMGFYIATLVFVGLWAFFGHRLRGFSLAEEREGGLENHRKSVRTSAIFLPIFAFSFCIVAFLWLMSLEPHWYSTIYAVYCFAGMFVSGAIITMLISSHLHEKGFLPGLTSDHLHDLGKFMFAFSIFWAYIWISQFLLIWYANISEEDTWFMSRFTDYPVLFFANVAINFAFPFLALMTRNAKRQVSKIRTIGIIMLFGRFLDLFLLIMPGVVGAYWDLGLLLMALGFFVVVGGIFFIAVFSGLAEAPLAATKHPYYNESLHHSTGV